MSTKTTFKRVALVAVASLGFGVLSTISASAGDVAVTAGKITSINGVALTANTNAINTSVGLAVGVTTASQTVTGELRLQIAGKITSYPVGGAVSVTGAEAAAAASDGDANVAGTMTYAYLLKQQGVHVTTAQRLLGHSDPRVTMGIYTQVLDTEIDDVGLLLSKAAGF